MNGSVTYEGLILQGGINVDTSADLEELTAYENGVYNPSEGKDGFSKVTVDVPAAVLDDITITENGHYTPPIGVDGYDDITVSVPHPAPVLDDITITENGSYQPPTGVDGYDDITVNVLPTLDDITITENGTYTPPTGTDGYNEITVNVPLPANGIYKQTLTGLPSHIATFTGADAPIDELIVSIDVVQSGSGDPSPTNVRPISGWSEATITNTDDLTDPTVTRTATISFGQTVYGGVLNVSTGELTITYICINIDKNTSITFNSSINGCVYQNSGFVPSISPETIGNYISNRLKAHINSGISSMSNEFTVDGTSAIIFKVDGLTTLEAYKTWLETNNLQFVAPLATPQTIQLTPTQVRSILGNNNVFADCGEVTELKYYSETP